MHRFELHIDRDHPSFAGHFPARPMLPGVVLLSEVLEAICSDAELARAVGATPRIASAKFMAPVEPGSDLVLQLLPGAPRLRFEVWRADRLIACGDFEADESTVRTDAAR